ncbi:hypothetical protein DPM13_07965 [Paracoccus mutanolyticus]|uniref:Phage tail protein n=2 Tax=Paracoccus mutanolyticus TaxID=1499308 RepID=A0ABM6WRE2_9RHOB|nr:hypothetical protein DPM13_07965 [Paracoccus mutanolyticus]
MTRWSRRIASPNAAIDLDLSEVRRVMAELENTKEEIGAATTKALRRTASALRVMASKRLTSELQIRKAMELRKRMKDMKLRVKSDGSAVMGMWFGLNDMGVSKFKGRIRKTPAGASFRGVEYPGTFVAKMAEDRLLSIYKRRGRDRFPVVEQTLPIKDQADVIIEDEIFPEATRIFMKNLLHELRYRARLRAEKAARGG